MLVRPYLGTIETAFNSAGWSGSRQMRAFPRTAGTTLRLVDGGGPVYSAGLAEAA